MSYKYIDSPPEPESIIISMVLVGTEGELDLSDGEFAVMSGEDQAKNLQDKFNAILKSHPEYRNYGWSLIIGTDKDEL